MIIEILTININTLSPIEALMKLNEIKRMLVKEYWFFYIEKY